MTVNDFIFSDQKTHQLRRHLAFWIIIGVVYYFQSLIPVSDPFYSAFISLYCYLPTCVLTVYAFIFFIWPKLQRRNYKDVVVGFIIISIINLVANYFVSFLYFSLKCDCPVATISSSQSLGIALDNTNNAISISMLALGIKFGKGLILKQRENQVLLKQKLSKELQFQKGRIYPAFIFKSLSRLDSKITSGSPMAPELLLRLSDLLSYLLYESSEELIPLEKELNMIRDLLTIEQINQSDYLSIESQFDVSQTNTNVKPLILFPLLHTCLEAIDHAQEQFQFQLNISEVKTMLHFSLVIEQLSQESKSMDWHKMIHSIQSKIDLLPNGNSHLEIIKQRITLTINLDLLSFNKIKHAI